MADNKPVKDAAKSRNRITSWALFAVLLWKIEDLETAMRENFSTPVKNQILNSLPVADFGRLQKEAEIVDLPLGKVLYQADEEINYVYFPLFAMISMVAYTAEGKGVEVAVIGNEGAVGIDVLLGSRSNPNQSITQMAGRGLRLKASILKTEFERGGALHDIVLGFTRSMIVQISQTALCNRLHSTEERLSRWLLMSHDRSTSDVLKLTQEFLAIMLGSNRATVTMTALELQRMGYITYRRGVIKVLNRKALEGVTCECYDIIRSAHSRHKPATVKNSTSMLAMRQTIW